MLVLVLNTGSSSLKYQVIRTDLELIGKDADERLAKGTVEHLEGDIAEALESVLNSKEVPRGGIDAVGHRVVHGGELFSESAVITEEVLDNIKQCAELAPLHNPKNIEGILAAKRLLGSDIPQVAVFDTAFHHRMPEHAYLYGLPYRFYEQYKLRRYGFHGTSHRYIAHRYRALRGLDRERTNIISLHLGNGCSAAAIKAGQSIDTSMGMTPLEGLVMGTRSGDLDPSLITAISRRESIPAERVEGLLNNQSGLLGISGATNDMRELEAKSQAGDKRAELAIDVFCYRARKYIGAYLAAMDGADAIVFAGGIGEHSANVRRRICSGMRWAGLQIDEDRNNAANACECEISANASAMKAYVIPTDEELLIARDTVRLILGVPHPS